MRLIIERQNDLVVCRVRPCDHWFFTACARGVKELLEEAGLKAGEFPIGSKYEFDLTPSNLRRIDNIGHETNINQMLQGGD